MRELKFLSTQAGTFEFFSASVSKNLLLSTVYWLAATHPVISRAPVVLLDALNSQQ